VLEMAQRPILERKNVFGARSIGFKTPACANFIADIGDECVRRVAT
jgi:hypothetical protein